METIEEVTVKKDPVNDQTIDPESNMLDEEKAEEERDHQELKNFVQSTAMDNEQVPNVETDHEDEDEPLIKSESVESSETQQSESSSQTPGTTRRTRNAKNRVQLGADIMPEAYHEQSKKTFTLVEDWDGVRVAIAAKLLVRARVTGVNDDKEFVYVEVGNIQGIIPKSEAALSKQTSSMVGLVGRNICFVIKGMDKKNGFFMASRAEGLAALSEAIRKELKEGELRTGVVSKIEPWGAWIELGGIFARLPRKELMYHFVSDISDVIKPGDAIDVKITHISDTGKVKVSLKQALANPWERVPKMFQVGDIKLGTITGMIPELIFIQLKPGIDIVAPWPKFPVRLHQEVRVKIWNIDMDKKRMSGSIWQVVQ